MKAGCIDKDIMEHANDTDEPSLNASLSEFASVFRDDLPAGLPPKREVEHEMELQSDCTPPHKPLFQLSPAELLATKEYIQDLLSKRKIGPSGSSYGAPLFFVRQKHTLLAGRNKCKFKTSEEEVLGLIVGKDGLKIGSVRIKAIKEWPKPESITELRSFLGLLQFFRRFITDFSGIARPMTDVTRKDSGIHEWDGDCQKAFTTLKRTLSSAPILTATDWSKSYTCHVDA